MGTLFAMRGSGGLAQVSVDRSSGLATVLLSNAAKRNALSSAMLHDLSEAFQALRGEREVRFVELKADGHVFSSGHDLKEMRAMDRQQQEALFSACNRVMRDIQTLPVPVMASLDGLAAAAGLQLLSACDMAVCTERSTFQLPGVRYGLFCTTPAVYAYRSSFASKSLFHMLVTGEPVDAAAGLRMGLVSHTFGDAAAMQRFVEASAEQVRALPRDVIAVGKSAFHRQVQMRNTGEAMEFASEVMVDNLAMPACRVGLDAFAEKKT